MIYRRGGHETAAEGEQRPVVDVARGRRRESRMVRRHVYTAVIRVIRAQCFRFVSGTQVQVLPRQTVFRRFRDTRRTGGHQRPDGDGERGTGVHRQHGRVVAVRFARGPVIQAGLLPVPAERPGRDQGLPERLVGAEHRRRAQHQLAELVVQLSGMKCGWTRARPIRRKMSRVPSKINSLNFFSPLFRMKNERFENFERRLFCNDRRFGYL